MIKESPPSNPVKEIEPANGPPLKILKNKVITRIPEREENKTQNLLKLGRVCKGLAGSFNISCDKFKAELITLVKIVKKAQLRGLNFRTANQDINQKSFCYLAKSLNRLKDLNSQLKLILELGHSNLQYEVNPYIKE